MPIPLLILAGAAIGGALFGAGATYVAMDSKIDDLENEKDKLTEALAKANIDALNAQTDADKAKKILEYQHELDALNLLLFSVGVSVGGSVGVEIDPKELLSLKEFIFGLTHHDSPAYIRDLLSLTIKDPPAIESLRPSIKVFRDHAKLIDLSNFDSWIGDVVSLMSRDESKNTRICSYLCSDDEFGDAA